MLLKPFYRVLVEGMQVACAIIFYQQIDYLNLTLVLGHLGSLAKPINNVVDSRAIESVGTPNVFLYTAIRCFTKC